MYDVEHIKQPLEKRVYYFRTLKNIQKDMVSINAKLP